MPIVLSNISSGYKKQTVLSEFSASFEKGQITAIIGPNGCGKSTLLKTVTGILPLFSGSIAVDGEALGSSAIRAKKIAFLSQDRNLPDMTAFETVLCGRFAHLSFPRIYSEKDKLFALECMKKLNVEELADCPISTLSGGMRQKVYIAMALCQDTDYILLDEPTTYLDISNVFEFFDILRTLANDGHGIVIVLHDLLTALSFSDRVLVMKDGKNVFLDVPERAVSSGVIKDVFGIGIGVSESTNDNMYFYERIK